MMKPTIKLCSAIALGCLLGGCQSIGLPGWSFKSRPKPASLAEMPHASSKEVLASAKEALREGNLSASVALFRIAREEPELAADANNGLGVAYARLGRLDVADRYFRAALEIEPDSQRFAANLLRLQAQASQLRSAANAARLAALSRAPSIAAATVPSQPEKAAVSRVAGRIERVSRGVVHIATPESLGNAPRMTVAYREEPSAADPTPPAEAQQPAADKSEPLAVVDKSKTYPVRFVLQQ